MIIFLIYIQGFTSGWEVEQRAPRVTAASRSWRTHRQVQLQHLQHHHSINASVKDVFPWSAFPIGKVSCLRGVSLADYEVQSGDVPDRTSATISSPTSMTEAVAMDDSSPHLLLNYPGFPP